MRARLVAIAFLFGCGGGLDINADQNNVCDQVAAVACHNVYQCCAETEIEHFLAVTDPRTESECRDDVSRRCIRATAQLTFGIEEKHLRFDSKIMNDCLNALVAPGNTCATIDSALPWTDACANSAWVGLVDDGGACLSSAECASKDSFCDGTRKCLALPGDGQPCNAGRCATGAFCSLGTTCLAKAAAGGACAASAECLEGLFCDVNAVPSVCAPIRAPDEVCTGNEACTSNQCNRGTCADNNQTCLTNRSCGRCANTNFACTTDGDCATGMCTVSGAFCSNFMPCAVGTMCVFPVKCNPGTCVGAVCAHATVDYCLGTQTELPVP